MIPIKKRVLTNDSNQPIAVQVDYADWLEIERILRERANGSSRASAGISDLIGSVKLPEDPLRYQNRVRGEWA